MPVTTKEALMKANLGRKMPNAAIEAMRSKKSKSWLLINPEGEIINVKNLSSFCNENNLLVSGLKLTLKTKKPVSKGLNTGWMIIKQL